MENNIRQQAFTLLQQGDYPQAEALFLAAMQQVAGDEEIIDALSVCMIHQGKSSAVVAMLEKELFSKPSQWRLLHRLGSLHYASGQYSFAMDCFLRLYENFKGVWSYSAYLAASYYGLKQFDKAIHYMSEALVINPVISNGHEMLVSAYSHLGRVYSAAALSEKFSGLPGLSKKMQSLCAEALAKAGIYDAAVKILKSSFDGSARYWLIMGFVQNQSRNFLSAIEAYKNLLELNDEDPVARTNLGVVQLESGDWFNGWNNFDARFSPGGPLRKVELNVPEWDGRHLIGEAVYVHSEQGVGDVIQFMRFFPKIEELGGRVLFNSYSDVLNLLKHQQGAKVLDSLDEVDLSYSWQIPVLNLGKIFAKSPEYFYSAPYIGADPALVDEWRLRLGHSGCLRVGLVWAGNPKHGNDANRSASLDDFAVLADIPGVQFFSMQKGYTERQVDFPPYGMNVVDLSKDIRNFADTAAIIEQLDLVISVDTSVVHLAGAMGKPVWVMLPREADWRWLDEGDSTAWYPSMRLFRLREYECWRDDLMPRVQDALIGFSRNKTAETHRGQWEAFDLWKKGLIAEAFSRYCAEECFIPAGFVKVLAGKACVVNESCGWAFDLDRMLYLFYSGDYEKCAEYFPVLKGEDWQVIHSRRLMAQALAMQGRGAELLALAQSLLKEYPENVEFEYWVGYAYFLLGEWGGAEQQFVKVIAVAPRRSNARVNLALALLHENKQDEAFEVLEKTVCFDKKHERAWLLLLDQIERQRAVNLKIITSEFALKYLPGSVELKKQLSNAYARAGNRELAAEVAFRLLAEHAEFDGRSLFEACAYAMQGRWNIAESLFQRQFVENKYIVGQWLSQHWLRTGAWDKGWEYWESRLLSEKSDSFGNVYPDWQVPRWEGQPLTGKLLVMAEQGFGDTFNFIHMLARIEGGVVLAVQDGLLPLLSLLDWPFELVGREAIKSEKPEVDYAVELMSLPWVLKLGGSIAPTRYPYIKLPALPEHSLANRLADLSGYKVGLIWAGNQRHGDTHLRDCPFEALANLLSQEGVAWCSLQKDEPSNQVLFVPGAAERLVNLAPELASWLDTAVVLSQLDLLITVDSAVAHLAGAMGVPVWLMLSKQSDWRWGEATTTTPWYPSMRIFRQPVLNDWASVVADVRQLLASHLSVGECYAE